jgi:hypothetical protein
MKKIIFITLLFCGLAFTAQSQSLTYSKVILVSSLDTVPQGKVWKITSFLASGNWMSSAGSNSANSVNVIIDGSTRFLAVSKNQAHYSQQNSNAPFPIWLPAGTTLEPSTNCGSLSIIEFTENNE